MFNRRSSKWFLVAGLCALLAYPAKADILSTFDSGDDGWNVVNLTNTSLDNYSILSTNAATFNATGGNPGGFISTVDPDNGDFEFHAPAAYLGNQSGATGLQYDLIHPIGANNYQTSDVILEGNGIRLLWRANPDLLPGTSWISAGLTFTPSSAWHVGTTSGITPTAADFQAVLGNLTNLYIRGEFTAGLGDSGGVDNIRLIGGQAAAPEPASGVLLGMMSLAAVFNARGKRRAA